MILQNHEVKSESNHLLGKADSEGSKILAVSSQELLDETNTVISWL